MRSTHRRITAELTEDELLLLRKLDFPCTEEILDDAQLTRYGYEISGTVVDFESLAGWLASEANHSPDESRAFILNDIADGIEAALSRRHSG